MKKSVIKTQLNLFKYNTIRMNLFVLDLEDYEPAFFYFLDSKPNLILENGIFTKVIYTHTFFTLNSVLFNVPIEIKKYEKIQNKYILFFDIENENNKYILEILRKLETQILYSYSSFTNQKRKSCTCLSNQLSCGNIRIYDYIHGAGNMVLNISGIWQDTNDFGMTFKWTQGITS
jgi:hypothetical protein